MSLERNSNIVVRLSEDSGAKNSGNLRVYVVNAAGAITEEAPFEGSEARLKKGKELLRERSKIYIGQAVPKEITEVDEDTLTTMGAYSVLLNFDNGNILNVTRLPAELFTPLPWQFCNIKGHLGKNFIVDGQSVSLPVCHARVHICHVERKFFWPIYLRPKFTIPDRILDDLKNKFLNLETSIPKFPETGKANRFVPAADTVSSKINRPLRSLTTKTDVQKRLSNNNLQPLPDEILRNITSDSLKTVKQTLIDHHELLHPYICLWPVFWPWFYWMTEKAVVTTDCNGDFGAWLFSFNHTKQNIYIWAEIQINGQWVTIYRPSIPCHIRWNYQCGTDININVTDPRVEPCDCGADGPADAVWFRSIGTTASAHTIEQSTISSVTLQGANLKNGGCTNIHKTQKISPFGSSLAFRIFIGANIFTTGATHYRWRWTQITDAEQEEIPPLLRKKGIISGSITRPYLIKISSTKYETKECVLGIEGTNENIAYRIPHQDITAETHISAADQAMSPEWLSVFFDSANLNTTPLDDGIYMFELELLKDVDGTFTVVPVEKSTFQISRAGDINSSEDAFPIFLNSLDANTAASFKINVRIDNKPCVADIYEVAIGDQLSGDCGFIKYDNYTDNVRISFQASHPRKFGYFTFGVVKGNNTQGTGVNGSGYVISSIPDFTLGGAGVFFTDVTVSQLLGTCPGQAAFSENLHVESLATNGSDLLTGYDGHDINAFALSNI